MPLLIDVRTQEEFTERHLTDAIHLPLDQIQMGELGILADTPKNTPIYLYCRSGNRSGMAKIILELKGYTQVTNAGGIDSMVSF